MSKVYKAKHTLNRGRGDSEMLPGTLFIPTKQQREDFEPLGAIEPASEAETALFEKQAKARGDKAPVQAEEVEAALEAEESAEAAAEEAKPAKGKAAKGKKSEDTDMVG